MKKYIFLYMAFVSTVTVFAQGQKIDAASLKKINELSGLTAYYAEKEPLKSLKYALEGSAFSQKVHQPLIEADFLNAVCYAHINLANLSTALQTIFRAKKITEDERNEENAELTYKPVNLGKPRYNSTKDLRLHLLTRCYNHIASAYGGLGNSDMQLRYLSDAKKMAEDSKNDIMISVVYMNLGSYYSRRDTEVALFYEEKAIALSKKIKLDRFLAAMYINMGQIYLSKHDAATAKKYFLKALSIATAKNDTRSISSVYSSLSSYYKFVGNNDSVLFYGKKSLEAAKKTLMPRLIFRGDTLLASIYREKRMPDSALVYLEHSVKIRDSLFTSQKSIEFQNIERAEQQRVQELQDAETEYVNRARMYTVLAGTVIILVVALFLWRNNRQRKKVNTLLNGQKTELQNTLLHLTLTQNQLIQSEKMASLGELTAGIAHEIQNPLNFVNNFSDVSIELLDEMNEEIDKGDTGEAKAIAADIKQNLEKIAHHGRRADGIVKGMLQHSRASSGQKEPTDINVLADEYLRLAYHGLRAKDKSFNAELVTNFAEGLPVVSIIPQDMGRVLLNLLTNAFYATQQRSRQVAAGSYRPTVEVSTQQKGNTIEITVKDNGVGIPPAIKDKILQPFFTTKPTGEGTGLGLSLSYDIVVKAHGGTIGIESTEGQGAVFIINLPV